METVHINEIEKVSKVYILKTTDENFLESVDVEPFIVNGNFEKWVLIVSTQLGCPVKCLFCDSGFDFKRNLTSFEILEQVEFMVKERNLDPNLFKKFKIQFARMGEPSFNDDLFDVMDILKDRYKKYIPCVSTIFPKNRRVWFEKLLKNKDNFYDFQLQFSIYSTNIKERDHIIPFEKEDLYFLNSYGEEFFRRGKRKVVLNFPVNDKNEISIERISEIFDKKSFIIKLTPVNPTFNAKNKDLSQESNSRMECLKKRLIDEGFDVIISIGEIRENEVGSNCGQSLLKILNKNIDFI